MRESILVKGGLWQSIVVNSAPDCEGIVPDCDKAGPDSEQIGPDCERISADFERIGPDRATNHPPLHFLGW